jgi:hypothetical protein
LDDPGLEPSELLLPEPGSLGQPGKHLDVSRDIRVFTFTLLVSVDGREGSVIYPYR